MSDPWKLHQPGCPCCTEEEPPEGVGMVALQVFGCSCAAPMPGAKVELTLSDGSSHTDLVADSNGWVCVSGLPCGTSITNVVAETGDGDDFRRGYLVYSGPPKSGCSPEDCFFLNPSEPSDCECSGDDPPDCPAHCRKFCVFLPVDEENYVCKCCTHPLPRELAYVDEQGSCTLVYDDSFGWWRGCYTFETDAGADWGICSTGHLPIAGCKQQTVVSYAWVRAVCGTGSTILPQPSSRPFGFPDPTCDPGVTKWAVSKQVPCCASWTAGPGDPTPSPGAQACPSDCIHPPPSCRPRPAPGSCADGQPELGGSFYCGMGGDVTCASDDDCQFLAISGTLVDAYRPGFYSPAMGAPYDTLGNYSITG